MNKLYLISHLNKSLLIKENFLIVATSIYDAFSKLDVEDIKFNSSQRDFMLDYWDLYLNIFSSREEIIEHVNKIFNKYVNRLLDSGEWNIKCINEVNNYKIEVKE